MLWRAAEKDVRSISIQTVGFGLTAVSHTRCTNQAVAEPLRRSADASRSTWLRMGSVHPAEFGWLTAVEFVLCCGVLQVTLEAVFLGIDERREWAGLRGTRWVSPFSSVDGIPLEAVLNRTNGRWLQSSTANPTLNRVERSLLSSSSLSRVEECGFKYVVAPGLRHVHSLHRLSLIFVSPRRHFDTMIRTLVRAGRARGMVAASLATRKREEAYSLCQMHYAVTGSAPVEAGSGGAGAAPTNALTRFAKEFGLQLPPV